MRQLMSQRAYARSRDERGLPGGTLRAVQKAIESGRIVLIEGKIDAQVADIQWERNTDPAQQQRGANGGAPENNHPASSAPAGLSQAPEGPPVGVQTSAPPPDQVNRIRDAARAEAAKAELLEFELAEKKGQLMRTELVRKAVFDKARIARNALLAIPDRLAPLLAAEPDASKVHAMLMTELRRVCAELAAGEDEPTRQ